MKIDASYKTPDYGKLTDCCSPAGGSKKGAKTPMKTVFPEITLRDCPDLAKAIEAGKPFKATVEFVATSINVTEGSSREYMEDGTAITLELKSLDVETKAKPTEDNMQTAGDAMRKWFKKK